MYLLRQLGKMRSFLSLTAHIIIILVAVFTTAVAARAQEKAIHLNPVIAKLVEGRPVYGLQAADFSLGNARESSRAPVDFVYADMEHNPMDFSALYTFLVGMSDRGMVLKKGNLQPNVALFARFPQEAEGSAWVVQQALDMGLMGFIFNGVSSKHQAEIAVKSMRYPQSRESRYPEPPGTRGSGAANATWVWGIGAAEYERHADVWPLNPDGDLLAIIMVETEEGVKNVDDIASVPGVGAIFVGAGSDMRMTMGVPAGSPAVEANFQIVLKACKAHKVPCAITANTPNDVARRVREGWSIIRSNVPAITAGRALLGENQNGTSPGGPRLGVN
jgi:4-hydroxy-2-oxoheptanedioate aldolase